ncbi:Endoplasmic reticulum mannosyl-oligosaccharide 1,2-alpha-mannosidase [Phytophthora cactorum]|uniref:alpha-1,2-Mannosidase n=1 Tax=Phytophthora cactorum TaxID=29920 RepID=A0A329SFH0_9STRA|nr:Endoplasmic reticulum mannosyl-oligosaccharide 1,2-alpha-mannosidase [Phytophthora cactorum]KAG2826503.1 Endoplasmic reticulum mannosyl-oligosaccharide 1,2-alpha-mannosidase [Phytophthora cactorum]KAG2828894.1 Endoplasmic reticulum mannosyl-oligosaccharide 1,2-alpha-mannosidase [Phytophthora cactorum]KAG2866350.1 Endoplasmic reticulum mannosyl-oligosaccharide 1,2-alpha-mannosidase [Phytophthora cactorum]KAG2928709.1 Endoplasmic reticulum mannosyl-oligosaccharide 1,2-alpha-mannosidase [Phytop
MKDDSVATAKRGAGQRLLWSMVAAMAVLSLFLLTYAHLIYLPAMTGERGYRQFFRARRHHSDRMGMSLREFYKKQTETFNKDQQKVVNMTRHAWHGYRKFAGWSDYLSMPKLEGGSVYGHDMALTTVDSLDTLFIMGLHMEFDEASAWVKANLSEIMFQKRTVSFFEITVRSLGGLLSAYYLSEQKHFLRLADSLGRALQTGFTCGDSVPCRAVDLEGHISHDEPLLSEAGSFQLEFAYLAHATEDDSFLLPVKHVNNIMANLVETRYSNGLIPVQMDWSSLKPQPGSVISVGALGDSHYEYLLKQWLLSGKQDIKLRDMYVTAVAGMKAELVGRSYPSNYAFVGKLIVTGELEPAMEHLTCFVPGMLALGYYHGMPTSHLELAKELTETCVQMYLQSASHLAPEITQFITEVNPNDIQGTQYELFAFPQQDYNILRPETVESLMILYRVTGDEIYREYGRIIMEAFEKQSKVEAGGYRSTLNVWYGKPTTKTGPMESFFIAETLKYLFLLFSDDDILPLDEIVFNTEAHPFPMWR